VGTSRSFLKTELINDSHCWLPGSQSDVGKFMPNACPTDSSSGHSSRPQHFRRRSVKPSASPSQVRILDLPPTPRSRSCVPGVTFARFAGPHVTSHRRLTPQPGYAFGVPQVGVVPVAAGAGDQGAADAVARGHLRASHADREQVIETLKVAFVQGRLAKDELDARVDQTFASRTYTELAAVTADLPAGLARPEPVCNPAPGEGERPVPRPGSVIRVATVLYAGVWPLALLVPWPNTATAVMGAVVRSWRHGGGCCCG
jgi:uncharacterized protein DUF1707